MFSAKSWKLRNSMTNKGWGSEKQTLRIGKHCMQHQWQTVVYLGYFTHSISAILCSSQHGSSQLLQILQSCDLELMNKCNMFNSFILRLVLSQWFAATPRPNVHIFSRQVLFFLKVVTVDRSSVKIPHFWFAACVWDWLFSKCCGARFWSFPKQEKERVTKCYYWLDVRFCIITKGWNVGHQAHVYFQLSQNDSGPTYKT